MALDVKLFDDGQMHEGADQKELEKLLDLAEQLLQNYERVRNISINVMLVQFLIAGVAILGTVIAFAAIPLLAPSAPSGSGPNSSSLSLLFTVIIGIFSFMFMLMISRTAANSTRSMNRERRALAELVSLIREVESASNRDASPLQRAEIRIRLSRFDIGPPS